MTNVIKSFSTNFLTATNTGFTIPSASQYHVGMVLTSSTNVPYVVIYGGGNANSTDGANYIFTASLTDTTNVPTNNFVNWSYNIPYKTLGTLNGIVSSIQSITASWAQTASVAISASNAASASNSLTSSYFYSVSGSGAWRIYVNQGTGDLTFAYF